MKAMDTEPRDPIPAINALDLQQPHAVIHLRP
jgi:hypothetical protein